MKKENDPLSEELLELIRKQIPSPSIIESDPCQPCVPVQFVVIKGGGEGEIIDMANNFCVGRFGLIDGDRFNAYQIGAVLYVEAVEDV